MTPLKAKYNLTKKGRATNIIMLELVKFSLLYYPEYDIQEEKKEKVIEKLERYFFP